MIVPLWFFFLSPIEDPPSGRLVYNRTGRVRSLPGLIPMYADSEFSPIAPGAQETFGLDFRKGGDLGPDETVLSVVWSVLRLSDKTSQPGCLIGAPLAGDVTTQKIGNTTPGEVYALSAQATTSKGNTPVLFSRVRCVPIQ